MKWLKTNIKKVSLGQYPMGFFYKGEQFFTSFFGGCISILFYLLVLAYALYILSDIFAKKQYVLTESLSEIDFQEFKNERRTLATVIEAMNPVIISVPMSNVTCQNASAIIYIDIKFKDKPNKLAFSCKEMDMPINQTNYKKVAFTFPNPGELAAYDFNTLGFQIICYNCGEYIILEKQRMYITNNQVQILTNSFQLTNDSMYLQTLQVLQVNSSNSIFAGFINRVWTQKFFINSEALIYYQNKGNQTIQIDFTYDKVQRNIEYMPKQLFAAISEIGGFASIVGIGTVVMGMIHQKLAERSLRKHTFKQDQEDDKDKSCIRINYEKVFLTEKQKQRKKEVAQLYSYENLKRVMERLEALDGGDTVEKEEEEEFKDAEGYSTKIQNEEESLLSV